MYIHSFLPIYANESLNSFHVTNVDVQYTSAYP